MRRSGPPARRKRLERHTRLVSKAAPARSPDQAGGRLPKRSRPLRPRSRKTAERDRLYSQLRAVFLGPEDRCTAGLQSCRGTASDVHHMMGRSARYMLNVATWARLCRPCHQWVTDHPAEAIRLGLSRHRRGEPPPMTAIASCSSCGKPIYWALTDGGVSIPLQADRYSRQPIEFEDTGKVGRLQTVAAAQSLFGDEPTDRGTLTVRSLGDQEAAHPEHPIYLSHFVDCPFSREHRKG